jgi:xylulokinase
MYLGVDLGTSSVKLLLANNKGIIVDAASAAYPNSFPHPNWSEQDPSDWWNGFCASLQTLGKRNDLKQIEALSFSGQMHGLVILDENDEIIRPAILWNDNRSTEECGYLNTLPVVNWTGNIALTGFTAPKLLWVKKHEPENFMRIRKILLPKDYIAYRLTGEFATDISDASGTLYFDVQNNRWSQPMLDVLGIYEEQLPAVRESVDIIGMVHADVGLSPDTRVIIGGGDQAMGAIGTGTVNDGQVSISLGTSGVLFINSENYPAENHGRLHAFRNANSQFHLMGVTLSCAGSTKWWVEDVLGRADYDTLLAGISTLPINDLLFLPYLLGERSPINDPDAKGVFYGLNASFGQKQMTKAVVEGVCLSLLDCLKTANECGIHPIEARVIGGGAKSPEWLQILSDVTGLTLHTIQTAEGGGLGAIILAMTACGQFSSVAEGCKALIQEERSFIPDQGRTLAYAEKYLDYKLIHYRSVQSKSADKE